MVLTLAPMTAFAENSKADEVTINGVTLNSTYPYLVGGAAAWAVPSMMACCLNNQII
jgi:hypothetical protein